jgi:predicted ATP-dependent endonuclease of OLD family
MKRFKILEFTIKNFRSISNLKLDSSKADLITLCGSNNIGKTNVLRALKIFFDNNSTIFNALEDIPYHIANGSRGEGFKTTLTAKIYDNTDKKTFIITKELTEKDDENKIILKGKQDKDLLSEKQCLEVLNNFQFFLIESSNVNLPILIREIINEEVLPLALDGRRGKTQLESLEILEKFIEKSETAVKKIEDELTKQLHSILINSKLLESGDWQLKIKFPEYNYLREAISNMIEFTLVDTNDNALEGKGSGIQRSVLLALIQYVNSKSKKSVIWALDEPEAFLQAGLQRNFYKNILNESKKSQFFITTHSQIFIDINNLKGTFLLETKPEPKFYARKKGKTFYQLNTHIFNGSEYQTIIKIKENFGIENNDAWQVMPKNILVEGETDKKVIQALCNKFDLTCPNVFFAGSVDRYKGYLSYFNDSSKDLDFRPKIKALFDSDIAGNDVYNQLRNKKNERYDLECLKIVRFDGTFCNGFELEDLIYPSIMFEAANAVLKKRGYKIIRKRNFDKILNTSNSKKPILIFLNEQAAEANSDKEAIDFNNYKMLLCEGIVKNLNALELSDLDKQYPHIKSFIESLINFD